MSDPVVPVIFLMIAGLWMLKDLRKEHMRLWAWRTLLAGVILLYLLSISPVITTLAYILEKDYLLGDAESIRQVDVLVVLGGGIVKRGLQSQFDLSPETSSRLLYGLQAMKQYNPEFLVLSGRSSEYMSEAEVMAHNATGLGIEEYRVIMETNSRNTWEHAIELDKLLKNKSMTIGIVTSAIHMKRSLMVFEKYFPEVVPLPSGYIYSQKKYSIYSFLPDSHSLYISSKIFHEFFGLLWYHLRS